MTPREKKLLAVLGVMASLGVVLGGYFLVVAPYQEAHAQARDLESQVSEKQATLEGYERKQRELRKLAPRSLPGETDVARREYESMLDALARSSGVPNGYTRTPKEPTDASRVPLLAPKQPAYSRVGYEIVLRKVDVSTLVKFLEGYYRQPLLQQISKFTIKRATVEAESGKTGPRNDLEVTILTEGLIIDGAEKRQTLYGVSPAFGALGGGGGLALLQQSPQIAKTILPASASSQLAEGREYKLLEAKNVFHGPLPEVKAPKAPKVDDTPKEVAKAPEAPKEDISPFIRLTGITWHSDGTVSAEIVDMANRHEYDVARVQTLDGLKVRVKKNWFLNGDRKPLDSFDDLVIQEDNTATDRKFKILEFTGEGLLLSESLSPAAVKEKEDVPGDEVKAGKSGGSKTSGKGKTTAKKAVAGPQAPGALAGAIVFIPAKPVEKRYLWKIGSTLKNITEMPTEVSPMPRIEK